MIPKFKDASEIKGSAEFSPCGRFRHQLDRWWDDGPRALVCMFNPSKAGATKNDPTIHSLIRLIWALRWPGFTGVNWEDYISTDPKALIKWRESRDADDEMSSLANLGRIRRLTEDAAIRIVAWGNLVPAGRSPYIDAHTACVVQAISSDGKYPLYCFGKTSSGAPIHPLARGRNLIRPGTPLEPWTHDR